MCCCSVFPVLVNHMLPALWAINSLTKVCVLNGCLLQQLQSAKKNLDLMTYMTRMDKYRVLIIDDIGYVKKSDGETQVLFEFIAHRYESGSLIITSNQPFSQWDQIFPDSMMTVAAVDRVIHHAHILEIEGESYREKQHLRK